MTVQVASAPTGAKGIDTIAPLSSEVARTFKQQGYSFAVRYLGAMAAGEISAILEAGLGLLAVGYSRRAGWQPTAAEGASDGAAAVQHAKDAGLLKGMTLFCDLEGPASTTTAADCVAYVNAWAAPVPAAGYIAGLYVGYGIPLTPQQLYQDLLVTAYWHSVSKVQAVAVRGYQMFQQSPGNQIINGVKVDVDIIVADANGDTPSWMIAVPDAANA